MIKKHPINKSKIKKPNSNIKLIKKNFTEKSKTNIIKKQKKEYSLKKLFSKNDLKALKGISFLTKTKKQNFTIKLQKKNFARKSKNSIKKNTHENMRNDEEDIPLEKMFSKNDLEDITDWEKEFNDETDEIWKEELKNMKKEINLGEILKKAEKEKNEFFRKIDKPTISEKEITIQSVGKSHISLFNSWNSKKQKTEKKRKIKEKIKKAKNWFKLQNWKLTKNSENKSIFKLVKKIENTQIEIICKFQNPNLINIPKKEIRILNNENHYQDYIREIVAENLNNDSEEFIFNCDFFVIVKGKVNMLVFDIEIYEGIFKLNKIMPLDYQAFFGGFDQRIGMDVFEEEKKSFGDSGATEDFDNFFDQLYDNFGNLKSEKDFDEEIEEGFAEGNVFEKDIKKFFKKGFVNNIDNDKKEENEDNFNDEDENIIQNDINIKDENINENININSKENNYENINKHNIKNKNNFQNDEKIDKFFNPETNNENKQEKQNKKEEKKNNSPFQNDNKLNKEEITYKDLENLRLLYNGPYFRKMDLHFDTAFREYIFLLGIDTNFGTQVNYLSYLLFEEQEFNFEEQFSDFISDF